MEGDTLEAEPTFVWKEGMDLGRKYATQIGSNVDKWRCLLCQKAMSGGVRRVKEHIANISGNVSACPHSSEEDKRLCKEAIEAAKNKTKGKKAAALEIRREVNIDEDDDCIVVGQKKKNLGPMQRTNTTEKKTSELNGDTPKSVKRRGRPPKAYKSSTCGNGSNAGERTAEGIKKNGFTPMPVGLTCDGMRSPQDNIPCQFSPERSQTILSDQNGLIIEKRAVESYITVGKEVEVSFEKHDYGVWFPATVLKDFADNSYLVHFVYKRGCEVSPQRAIVKLPHIRPQPPQHKNRSFFLLDKVDVFFDCVWTSGLIIKEFTDKRFMVSFKGKKTKVFRKIKLRPHMEWVDGRWIDASKSREADNDASHLRLSNKIITIDAAEIPTLTAYETETMNSMLSSQQHSTSIVCQTDAVVMRAPGIGQSSRETENRSLENKVTKEKKISELDSDTPKIVKRTGRPQKIDKSTINGMLNTSFLGLKCSLWDCTRPAQRFDYCSSHHAALALKEGAPGMTPVLRPGGTGVKDSLFFVILNAKAQSKDVGIPECERAATAKSPWNAPELFDITVLEGETIREWLFFDKPRKAFENGNRKQRSLSDYNGRGWHESRKQVMNDFNGQKRSYYMDPQPRKDFEWHLYEYEIFKFDACALYRLELKRVGDKKSSKGKSPNDSADDLQKQMGRSSVLLEPRIRMEIPTNGNSTYPGVRIAEGTEEKDCEMMDIASILIGSTNNGTRSPQDNIPCQSPPEGSQKFTSDQKDQENVSARLTIEERAGNSLSKQMGVSLELLDRRSRMEIPTESSEKAEMGTHYLSKGGKSSADSSTESLHLIHDGVRAAEGRKESDCETEDIAPILTDLTCDGVRSPKDNIPCQSSSERSQAFIHDQNGEGKVLERFVIEENAGSSLTKQMGTPPKLLEPSNRMGIPTNFVEKDKCLVSSDNMGKCYVRKRRKRSANLSTESAHSFVDGASSKETEVHNVAAKSTPGIDLDVNQILPFKKTLPLWESIESMEEFQLFPQRPHFRALENIDEYCREGLAVGQMATFLNIVKTMREMRADMTRSSIEKCLENLIALEDNGFDVRTISDCLKKLEQESQIMELKKKKRKIDEDVDEIQKNLKELQAKHEVVMSKKEVRDAAIKASRSLLNNINDRLKSIQFTFEEMAAAPC